VLLLLLLLLRYSPALVLHGTDTAKQLSFMQLSLEVRRAAALLRQSKAFETLCAVRRSRWPNRVTFTSNQRITLTRKLVP
jgi:hypothetical protein